MIDKKSLIERLKAMVELPSDWDGFGTEPLDPRVYSVASKLIDIVPDSCFGLQIFVGVNNPGSLYLEFDLNRKRIEMTILDTGIIHFDETIAGNLVGSGSFHLSADAVKELLNS